MTEKQLQMIETPQVPSAPAAPTYAPEIAAAISAIMGEVDYVQKKGTNTFHNYKFAAVGDILAKLQPAMAKHGLIVIQNEMEHKLDGPVMMVKYEFIVAHKSGAVLPDRFHATGVATATNSKGGFDDKCVNKCMTAAGKYFLLSLFKIPTGDLPDSDEQEDRPAQNSKTANGNGGFVTDKQAMDLEALADEIGGDKKNLLAYFKADSFATLHAADHGRILDFLQKKKAARK